MATRHQVREAVVSLLYAYDIGNRDIKKFKDDILEDKKIRNKQKEFALELLQGVLENTDSLDKKINKHLKEWKIDEIGHVERSILRLATFELLQQKIDDAVIINEAIELAKTLCSESVPRFVNGVLGALQKELKQKKGE